MVSKCSKDLYRRFLQASSVRYSGLALSEVAPEKLSHDSVSRWLKSKKFRPREIWDLAKPYVRPQNRGILICDDTILDKHRSEKIELVKPQYSGNAHGVIAGIGLVNLLWHDMDTEESIPVDYRIYDKEGDGKTKNDHFQNMLCLAKERGLRPEVVVMDTWYSSLDNLKTVRNLGWTWVAGLRKNRKVNRGDTLESLTFPDEGLKLHLRGYGWITVFRFVAKNGRTDYIGTNINAPARDHIKSIMKARWHVEVYHRELKQTCGIESCQAHTGRAQRNHIFLAISAWIQQSQRRYRETISLYKQKWNVLKHAIAEHLRQLMRQPSIG